MAAASYISWVFCARTWCTVVRVENEEFSWCEREVRSLRTAGRSCEPSTGSAESLGLWLVRNFDGGREDMDQVENLSYLC